jgi:hypothetical protein
MNILSTIAVLVASTAVTIRALAPNEKNATLESISLVDGEGRQWALLGKNPRTQTEGIYLLNKAERIVAELVLDNRESPHLLFKSSQGDWRMSLNLSSDNECDLSFLGESSHGMSRSPRAKIGMTPPPDAKDASRNSGVLLIRDTDGQPLVDQRSKWPR